MLTTAAAFVSTAALLAASIPNVDAHGYMLIPESQFKGSANSAWIVQIDPVWASDKWDGNNAKSVDTFKSLKAASNFKDLRTLMDDTSVYGADCGFTNPNDTPQPIPSDGKATFSRALVHHGPCGIWLDDKMVLYEDDCFAKYGNENQESCNGGCKQMRFYWLAFQGLNKKTVWQSYKDCIPLKGSGGGGGGSPAAQAESSQNTGDVSQTTSSGSSHSSPSDSPNQGSQAETPEVTPAPSSKCNGRKRRY
ncbi:hypothetical protein PInf_006606 [Phytophthora infestans]|nr:hypothetical protein PInf_006606 [Phytophthora infestans]